MEYINVLLAQRHVELEKILMNPAALPITERASINAHLKHTNKALDDRVEKSRIASTQHGNQANLGKLQSQA